jgi:hypothetical protein
MTLLHVHRLTIGIDAIQSCPARALPLWLTVINIDIPTMIVDWTMGLLMMDLRLRLCALGNLVAYDSAQDCTKKFTIVGASRCSHKGQDHDVQDDEKLFHVNSLSTKNNSA